MVKLLDWNVFSQTCTLESIETGERVKLSPRTMDVLRYLIEAQGRVVSSSELLDKFWSKSVNSDHAVHNAIAELRSALGDHASNPRYIKTYPKRGYSLIAGVENIDSKDQTHTALSKPQFFEGKWTLGLAAVGSIIFIGLIGLWINPQMADSDPDILLVRPFENINVDTNNRFWTDQLPASLVTHLSKLPDTVIVRGFGDFAAEQYVQANLLGEVDYFLGGIVQQGNSELRLQIDLIDAIDSSIVYSDQFDISSSQVFDVHDEIGSSIVSALSIYLDEDQRKDMEDWGTSNPNAYSRFLEAGFYAANSNHNDLELAIEYYLEATAEDPNFVNAYAGLARAASNLGSYSHEPRNDRLRAIANDALREVTRIDPQSESIIELQNHFLRLEAGSKTLIEETLRELILSGSESSFVYSRYAVLLAEARLYDEAAQFLSFVEEEEPFQIPQRATWLYQTFFDTPDNLIQTQKMILLERPDHIGIMSALIRGLAFVGDYRQATYYLQRLMDIDEEGPFTMLSQATISGLWGNSVDVGDQFERNNVLNPDYNLSHGVKSFIRGDLESGARYWRSLNAADTRRLSIIAHKVELYFPDNVLEDSRYQALLEELGIGISWQRHLMESVLAMSSITGINLSPQSVSAYDNNEFLGRNNLWDHAEIAYPNREGGLKPIPP